MKIALKLRFLYILGGSRLLCGAAHMVAAAAAGSRHDNNNRRAPYIFPFLASYWKTLAADAL